MTKPITPTPGVYSFHVHRNTVTGKQHVVATHEKKKTEAQIDNLKYSAIQQFGTWDGLTRSAVLGVKWIEDEAALLEILSIYEAKWGQEGGGGSDGSPMEGR